MTLRAQAGGGGAGGRRAWSRSLVVVGVHALLCCITGWIAAQHELTCRSGALADMQSHGVEAIDCFAVDNALIKPADPLFVGHCHSQQSDCGGFFCIMATPGICL